VTVVAILQARMSSTRLPGKVLKPIMGRPMLALQIERIRLARRVDRLVVATSINAEDDTIAALCRAEGISFYRGALNDVLARFAGAAREHAADHIVRLTGDCPLTDPAVVDAVIAHHLEGGFAYTSNCYPRSYPDGLDVEMMTRAALDEAAAEADQPMQREHVTPFIAFQPDRFPRGNIALPEDRSALRITVDDAEDLEVVAAIFGALHPGDPAFGTDAILAFLDTRPDLIARNAHLSKYG
jgi:spore coat polysaccharide biosynthesis protein SpsF